MLFRSTVTLTLNSSTAYVVGTTGSVVVIADNDVGRARLTTAGAGVVAPPTSPFSDRRLGDEASDDDVITTLLA